MPSRYAERKAPDIRRNQQMSVGREVIRAVESEIVEKHPSRAYGYEPGFFLSMRFSPKYWGQSLFIDFNRVQELTSPHERKPDEIISIVRGLRGFELNSKLSI
jgi:hypothetical protein